MKWHSFLLKKNLLSTIKHDKREREREYKTELERLVEKYDLELIQNNLRTNQKYYIQYDTNLIYRISKIGHVYFVSIEV